MDERLVKRLEKLKRDAAAGGYKLNSDEGFVAELCAGLLANQDRYGIESCPCRLYTGDTADNMDIVCPCAYRDDDLAEYGACFCALYVSGEAQTKQVPERRPPLEQRREKAKPKGIDGNAAAALPYPVFRCSVCGYLCANNNPPRVCPICKAAAERFERFI